MIYYFYSRRKILCRSITPIFWKAFTYGLLASIACALALSYLLHVTTHLANLVFTAFYLIPGYLIPKAIHRAGGGIGKKYAYMGAGLTFLSLLLTDLFFLMGYDILLHPQVWGVAIRLVVTNWFQLENMGILTLFFMASSIYLAYRDSDITTRS